MNIKPKDKNELKQRLASEAKKITLDDLASCSEDRVSIDVDGTVFENYIFYGKKERLYIFLSAIGDSNVEYPKFTRATWPLWLAFNSVLIDDPTRKELSFAPAFFIGSKNKENISKIIKLIQSFQKKFDVSEENTYIISSSNGGYAAIYIAKYLNIKVIAYNPQFSIPTFIDSLSDSSFVKLNYYLKSGFDLKENDIRLTAVDSFKNKHAKFFIYINISSKTDRDQLNFLSKNLDFKWNLGANRISDNLTLLIVEVDADNPHSVQPSFDATRIFIEYLAGNIGPRVFWPVMKITASELKLVQKYDKSI